MANSLHSTDATNAPPASSYPFVRTACLLSLGSDKYDQLALSRISEWQNETKAVITFILLDDLEGINREVLGTDIKSVSYFKDLIGRAEWRGEIEIFQNSEIAKHPEYNKLEQQIGSLYKCCKSFQNICNTQVYRSLQPRLKALGIRNQRSHVVKSLSGYVIKELSLLAFLRTRMACSHEIGFHEVMLPAQWLNEKKRGSFSFPDLITLTIPSRSSKVNLRDLVVSLGDGARKIGPLNLAFEHSTVVGIIGPNGCGKTSLLLALGGHESITSGDFEIAGRLMNNLGPFERRTATVFQDAGLFPHKTAEENLSLGAKKALLASGSAPKAASAEEKVKRFVSQFYLGKFAQTQAGVLSGGEGQIISLGRAILSEPSLLLLDEPTASLDQLRKRSALLYIRHYCTEYAVPAIIVSHDSEVLFTLCDRILVVGEKGNVLADAPIDSLRLGAGSLTAARLVGLPNLFEAEVALNGEVTLAQPGMQINVDGEEVSKGVRGLHIPATHWQISEGPLDLPPAAGVLFSGWLEWVRRDDAGWLLFLKAFATPTGGAKTTRNFVAIKFAGKEFGLEHSARVSLFAELKDIVFLSD